MRAELHGTTRFNILNHDQCVAFILFHFAAHSKGKLTSFFQMRFFLHTIVLLINTLVNIHFNLALGSKRHISSHWVTNAGLF